MGYRGVPMDVSRRRPPSLLVGNNGYNMRKPSGTTHHFKANPYDGGIGWYDPENHLLAALRDDKQFTVAGTKNLNVELDLPDAHSAAKALETCEVDLVNAWGLEANLLRPPSVHAKPSNYPGGWVTTGDYPRDDFVRRNEGVTSFRLLVGADGSVKGCRIIGSSGFPSLDKRTCDLLRVRAAFRPATDEAGRAVLDTYSNRVSWQTPR